MDIDNQPMTSLIIVLVSIAVGMIIGLILKPEDKYHGPNAIEETKKVYFDKKTGKYIRFVIQPVVCPKPRKKIYKALAGLV